jgi:hypothetical protein
MNAMHMLWQLLQPAAVISCVNGLTLVVVVYNIPQHVFVLPVRHS